MDAERLERAARALLVRVDGLCGGKGSAFALPSDALRSERDALRAALAAQPAQAGGALPTSLLPVARALLRDADTALGNTGGMRVGLPKATVDASRLRHVVAAVVAHLEAQRPGGAA